MAYNKFTKKDGTVLLDLTADTVTANNLAKGIIAHDKSGAVIEGLYEVEEWDGSGVVIEVLASTGLITFTVYGKEYQAEDGMTWAEFIDSEYNPDTNYDTSTTSIEKRFELFNSAVYYASDEYNRRPLITEEGSTGNVYSTDVVQPIEYDYYVAPGGSN